MHYHSHCVQLPCISHPYIYHEETLAFTTNGSFEGVHYFNNYSFGPS